MIYRVGAENINA